MGERARALFLFAAVRLSLRFTIGTNPFRIHSEGGVLGI